MGKEHDVIDYTKLDPEAYSRRVRKQNLKGEAESATYPKGGELERMKKDSQAQ